MAIARKLSSVSPPGGALVTAAPSPQVAAATELKGDTKWFVFALGLVVAGAVGGSVLFVQIDPPPFTPRDGISALAVFYIVAQAIERLLEVSGHWIGSVQVNGETVDKKGAVAKRDQALAAMYETTGRTTPQEALANAQLVVNRVRANRKIGVWGGASFLALLACGALGLLLLQAVGLSSAPAWLDILVTGVVIGGGTKSLHDVISNIEKAKEQKEDPAETRP